MARGWGQDACRYGKQQTERSATATAACGNP